MTDYLYHKRETGPGDISHGVEFFVGSHTTYINLFIAGTLASRITDGQVAKLSTAEINSLASIGVKVVPTKDDPGLFRSVEPVRLGRSYRMVKSMKPKSGGIPHGLVDAEGWLIQHNISRQGI